MSESLDVLDLIDLFRAEAETQTATLNERLLVLERDGSAAS